MCKNLSLAPSFKPKVLACYEEVCPAQVQIIGRKAGEKCSLLYSPRGYKCVLETF